MTIDMIDPVTLAVLNGRLIGIADEMDATLYRSAFNPIIAEAHDACHDANAALAVVRCRSFGQPYDTRLGGDVLTSIWYSDATKGRCRVDDASSSARNHVANLMLHTIENAGQIDSQRPVPFLGRDVMQWFRALLDTCIVEGAIEASKAHYDLIY